MKMIQTVTGLIPRSELGVIAPHEHFFCDTTLEAEPPADAAARALFEEKVSQSNIPLLKKNPFTVRDNMLLDDLKTAEYELSFFKKAGGTTVVDLSNVGLGRDPAKVKQLSENTDVNIILGCGLYYALFLPDQWQKASAEKIADWMIKEIREGIDDTGIKPGVIGEIGTSEILYDVERRSVLAAAWANRETGLPIYIHTYSWSDVSLEAIDIMTKEGVPPEQICICHMDVDIQYDYIQKVFDKGAWVEFDDFGKQYPLEKTEAAFSGGPFALDTDRVKALNRLVKGGYTDRLLLATDVCLKELLHTFGGTGYDHIYKNIVPMMEREGIDPEAIKQIVYRNPETFLCG